MENLIVAASSVIATLLAVWGTVIYPRRKERIKLEVIEHSRQERRDLVIDGIPAIEGMTTGVQPLAIRLEKVEQGQNEVKAGQALLEQRMNEANGTGRRTEQKLDLLLTALPSIEIPRELKKS